MIGADFLSRIITNKLWCSGKEESAKLALSGGLSKLADANLPVNKPNTTRGAGMHRWYHQDRTHHMLKISMALYLKGGFFFAHDENVHDF